MPRRYHAYYTAIIVTCPLFSCRQKRRRLSSVRSSSPIGFRAGVPRLSDAICPFDYVRHLPLLPSMRAIFFFSFKIISLHAIFSHSLVLFIGYCLVILPLFHCPCHHYYRYMPLKGLDRDAFLHYLDITCPPPLLPPASAFSSFFTVADMT